MPWDKRGSLLKGMMTDTRSSAMPRTSLPLQVLMMKGWGSASALVDNERCQGQFTHTAYSLDYFHVSQDTMCIVRNQGHNLYGAQK